MYGCKVPVGFKKETNSSSICLFQETQDLFHKTKTTDKDNRQRTAKKADRNAHIIIGMRKKKMLTLAELEGGKVQLKSRKQESINIC